MKDCIGSLKKFVSEFLEKNVEVKTLMTQQPREEIHQYFYEKNTYQTN